MNKPQSISPETRSILNAIRRVFQTLRVASRDSERTVGLSAAQLFVLRKLEETDGLSLNELAEATLTHQSSVSVVVTKLVEKGLVRRERSKHDGRQLVLGMTTKGTNLLKKAPKPAQDWLIIGIEKLDIKSRKELDKGLSKLLTKLDLPTSKPAPMLFDNPDTKKTSAGRKTKKE